MLAHHDVLGLQVAVKYSLLMGILDGLSAAAEDVHQLMQGALPGQTVQRHALDLLHGEVVAPVVQAPGVMHGNEPRVLQACRAAGLEGEALQDVSSSGELGPEHLHGDHPLQLLVDDAVDLTHRALAEQAQHLIPRRKCGNEGVAAVVGGHSNSQLGA